MTVPEGKSPALIGQPANHAIRNSETEHRSSGQNYALNVFNEIMGLKEIGFPRAGRGAAYIHSPNCTVRAEND
jgi:hypothetical protein